MKLLALVSGGKDSWYALYLMMQSGHDIPVAVTFVPRNPDSYMLQRAMTEKVREQFASLKREFKIRHREFGVSGEKEKEVEEMKELLAPIVKKERIEGIICGAVLSEYQRRRLDYICEELGVKSFAPLWHKNEEALLKEIVMGAGFEFMVARVCAEGIEQWRGKTVTAGNIEGFISDLKKARCNVSGEGGEYETFVTKAPFLRNIN
ncbi:MAG: diphthine--ammonia ligase [Candidatus Aenigmatarchaeota archaeon]